MKIVILTTDTLNNPDGISTFINHLSAVFKGVTIVSSPFIDEHKKTIESADVIFFVYIYTKKQDQWFLEYLLKSGKRIITILQTLLWKEKEYIEECVKYYFPEYEIAENDIDNSIVYYKRLFNISGKIVLISHKEQEHFIEKYEYPDKIKIIYNLIDERQVDYNNIKKNYNLGYLGRLSYRKGILTLLSVMEYLSDYNLRIHGDINRVTEKDLIGAFFARFLSEKNIFYRGVIERNDKEAFSNYYKEISLSLLPSLYEPFGYAHVESMLNGVFPIIGKNTGTVDVFGEDYPFICGDDVFELKGLIEKYMSFSISDLNDLAKIIDKKFDKFRYEEFSRKYQELI